MKEQTFDQKFRSMFDNSIQELIREGKMPPDAICTEGDLTIYNCPLIPISDDPLVKVGLIFRAHLSDVLQEDHDQDVSALLQKGLSHPDFIPTDKDYCEVSTPSKISKFKIIQ